MIGEGDHVDARDPRLPHHLAGSVGAVGNDGMGVKVNAHGATLAAAHVRP